MRNAFNERAITGLFGEYWFLTECAKRKIKAQRLCENLSGADIITQNNIVIEIKTSQAHLIKEDSQHRETRAWQFNSIRKGTVKNPDVLVCIGLSDVNAFEVEHLWIIPTKDITGESGYKNNFCIKDTRWQRNNSPRNDLVREKWVEKYENKWGFIK